MDVTHNSFIIQETVWFQNINSNYIIIFQHSIWTPNTCSTWGQYWHRHHGSITKRKHKVVQELSVKVFVELLSISKIHWEHCVGNTAFRASKQKHKLLRWWHYRGLNIASTLNWISSLLYSSLAFASRHHHSYFYLGCSLFFCKKYKQEAIFVFLNRFWKWKED